MCTNKLIVLCLLWSQSRVLERAIGRASLGLLFSTNNHIYLGVTCFISAQTLWTNGQCVTSSQFQEGGNLTSERKWLPGYQLQGLHPYKSKEALRDVGMISSVTKKSQRTSAFFPMGASRTGGMKWALGDGSLAFRALARKGEVQDQSCMWEQSRGISPPANCPASCFGDRLTASFPTVDGSGTQRSDLEKITLQIHHSSGEAS